MNLGMSLLLFYVFDYVDESLCILRFYQFNVKISFPPGIQVV